MKWKHSPGCWGVALQQPVYLPRDDRPPLKVRDERLAIFAPVPKSEVMPGRESEEWCIGDVPLGVPPRSWEEQHANATLMSAAPALLFGLEEALEAISSGRVDRAREIIEGSIAQYAERLEHEVPER
jgi:hypothetical protein